MVSHAPSGPVVPVPGTRIARKRSAKESFASTVLVLEAVLVLFLTMVAYGLRTVPSVWPVFAPPPAHVIWIAGGVLVVVLLVLSRLVSAPGGEVAGSVVQLPVLACGLAVPLMFLMGGVFISLWVSALVLGTRIDRERAAYDAEHPETAPNV